MNTEFAYFFTATILNWEKLLIEDHYKAIIVKSLEFMVSNKRAIVYGFVVMPNHIHIIWKPIGGYPYPSLKRDFLKFTSQQIKFEVIKMNPEKLQMFKVEVKDRQYQFWKYKPLSIPLWTLEVAEQKLNYIHNNPIQDHWKLCKFPEDYLYSSASFYSRNVDNWGFITNIKD